MTTASGQGPLCVQKALVHQETLRKNLLQGPVGDVVVLQLDLLNLALLGLSLSTLLESALKAAGVFVLKGRSVKRMTPIILSAESYLLGFSALVIISPR